jgi:YjjG family noncanonical pyrimidine nucleotidase
MKFQPKAIFFDWDHTLWDHDRNAKEVLFELFNEFELLPNIQMDFQAILEIFYQINDRLWERYQTGEITQSYLRENRFKDYFTALNIQGNVEQFSQEYLFRTPRKNNLIDGASTVVGQLAEKYPLYILTNGFDDIQYVKVDGSGIGHFFQKLITSEQIGTKKPDPRFFEYALKMAKCEANEVIMIGDHEVADIRGAEDVGITAIHFHTKTSETKSKTIIHQLSELLHLIELN